MGHRQDCHSHSLVQENEDFISDNKELLLLLKKKAAQVERENLKLIDKRSDFM